MTLLTLSSTVAATMLPPIPKAQAWIKAYDNSAGPLLNLSQGVPGDPPRPEVLEGLAATSSDPASAGYGAIAGEPQLREMMAAEMEDIYKWGSNEGARGVSAGNIMITGGANAAYMTAIMSICERDDELIIPIPWYFNALMGCQLLGIKVVPLPLDPNNGFLPSVKAAESLITPKTRGILLVTPNNPTGTTYSPDLLDDFADLARSRKVALIVDETYRDFVKLEADGSRGKPHRLFERPYWEDTVVSIFSFSKSYKIPGHRLGGLVGGQAVCGHATKVLDCLQICAPRPPQLAIAPLLATLRNDLIATGSKIANRLSLFKDQVESVHGWQVASQGGFYSYVKHPYESVPSVEVSRRLGEEFGVITLPGSFFMPEDGTHEQAKLLQGGSPLTSDRWIRFAVANVDDSAVMQLRPRLEALNKAYGL